MKKTLKYGFSLLQVMLVIAILGILAALALPAQAQVYPRSVKSALTAPVTCLTATTNLPVSLLVTNTIPQGRHLGIGINLVGGDATNTGLVALQWKVKFAGANNLVTTTKPFITTFTATGTTAVRDWAVLPDYTLGPGDALILSGITNAAVNVGGAASSVTISNVWLQTGS